MSDLSKAATIKNTKKKKSHFTLFMIAGIVLGCIVGLVWPDASVLKPLGTVYINAIFCVVVPMVFFSIASSIANMTDRGKARKILVITVVLFAVTAMIAALFMLGVISVVPASVGKYPQVEADVDAALSVPDLIVNFLTQSDFTALFSRKAILPLIVAAVIFGFAIQKTGGKESPTAKLFTNISDCLVNTVKIINYYAPIGFFGFFADLVSNLGPSFVTDYGRLMIIYYITASAYFVIFTPLYSLWGGGIAGLKIVLKHIFAPMSVSFGTCSSVATMPTNIEQANDSHISPEVTNLVVPLGATMHMDGIALTTVLKIAFLSQMFGMRFSLGEGLLAVAVAVLASVASPGIPGGGNTGSLVLCTIFFPEHFAIAYPIAAAIGNMVDPISTMVNSALDYVATFIVSRYTEGKDWLKNKLAAENKTE